MHADCPPAPVLAPVLALGGDDDDDADDDDDDADPPPDDDEDGENGGGGGSGDDEAAANDDDGLDLPAVRKRSRDGSMKYALAQDCE